ncbi:MAG: thioredoxin [Candidatus Daviesbacteria bacterium]|nr:MAG: thioredoxin [Candidatus Daviesbacteria bacterium]
MLIFIPMTVKFLDFWAPWCSPCKMMNPILEELKKEWGDKVEVVEINVDENPSEAQKYGVMSIPTYVIEKDGKEIGRKIGVTSKEELNKLALS